MTESIKQWPSAIGFGRGLQAAALTKRHRKNVEKRWLARSLSDDLFVNCGRRRLETAARAQHVKVSPATERVGERARERFAASHAIKIKSGAREK